MESVLAEEDHYLLNKLSSFDPTQTLVTTSLTAADIPYGSILNLPPDKNAIITLANFYSNGSGIGDFSMTITVGATGSTGATGSILYQQGLEAFNTAISSIQSIINYSWSKYDNTFVLYYPLYNNIGNSNFYTTSASANNISIQNNQNITSDLLIPGGKSVIIVIEQNSVPLGTTLTINLQRSKPTYCLLPQYSSSSTSSTSSSSSTTNSSGAINKNVFWIVIGILLFFVILLFCLLSFGVNCINTSDISESNVSDTSNISGDVNADT